MEILIATSARNIGDTVAAVGIFNTVVATATAADFDGMLKGAGPFPGFVLTDDALAKLPPGMIESLVRLKTGRD